MVPLFWFWPLPEPIFGFGRRSKEGWGHNFSTQWNQWMRSFGFGPSRAHFWFWEALKGGLGSQLFDPMEPVDEKFWVWPLPSPFLVLGGAQRRVGVTTFRPNGTSG